jgi:DNA-binding NarL/FixJ family response regulator
VNSVRRRCEVSHEHLIDLSSAARTIPAVHSPSASVRVVVADDHPFYRAGLTRELRANGIDVVAEVPNAAAAIAAVVEHAPDVAIMDLNMPGMAGAAAIRRLREQAPGARVVVLTVSAEGPDMADAMLSGATGYVLKDDLPEDIVRTVRAAAVGESAISPRAAGMLLMRARCGGATLGRQELGVLELLAEGRAEQEIAETVKSGRRSMREHLLGVLLKLAVDDLAGDDRGRRLRVVRGHVA